MGSTVANTKKYDLCCESTDDTFVGETSSSSCSPTCQSSTSTNLAGYSGTCIYYGKALSGGPSEASLKVNGTKACEDFCVGGGEGFSEVRNRRARQESNASGAKEEIVECLTPPPALL